jgi:glucose/mannose-6-phosphate isomerase
VYFSGLYFKKMMKALIEGFPQQVRDALEIFNQVQLKPLPRKINNVLISGLGGSGIGGSIVSEICAGSASVPISVSKDYAIPAWVNEDTLVIVSSYSGNTEETLQAMQAAINQKAMIVCVTSGGEVLSIAKEHNLDVILIPGGNPPRSCLGLSLTQLCGILEFYGVAQGLLKEIQLGVELIELHHTRILQESESIAKAIAFSIPVLYTSVGYEGVAVRFRQQLNENSKMLCWHHVMPEMNHNELVGWVEKSPQIAAIFMRNADEYYRTAKRMDICKDIIFGFAGKTIVLNSKGDTPIQRMIWWINLGDWISWFASVERNVDAIEINVINRLKNELANLQ